MKDPAGCIRAPPGDRPAHCRALCDSFTPILVNRYNGHRTVSKSAGQLPFGARADPCKVPGVMLIELKTPSWVWTWVWDFLVIITLGLPHSSLNNGASSKASPNATSPPPGSTLEDPQYPAATVSSKSPFFGPFIYFCR